MPDTPDRPDRPPMHPSNEATGDQLTIARHEGDAYGQALQNMHRKEGGNLAEVGDYVVAFVQENAEGLYAHEGTGLVWRETPEQANCHLEVAVADSGDGRFVPSLDVQVTLLRHGQTVLESTAPFLWHPYLHHYGFDAQVPDEGPYDIAIRINAATFLRHDPINGKRYAEPVTVTFPDVRFELGRKISPDAAPRGEAAPVASYRA